MSRALQTIGLAAIGSLMLAAGEPKSEIRGSAVDINSRPLANVAVSLRAKEPGSARSAITDRNGTFAFTDLPPGTYSTTSGELGGFNPVLARELNIGPQDRILTLRLEMEVGVCPLSPGLPHYFRLLDHTDDKHLSAFAGTVVNENGIAIPGADVALYIPARGKIASTHTGENGLFSFAGLTVDSRLLDPSAQPWILGHRVHES